MTERQRWAIAIGHPFGMTGARITSTLINSLQTHDKQFGLETMCVGRGQGMVLIPERSPDPKSHRSNP
ncbi:acetyl-CoA acetyltransferase [Rhodococcus opacus]|nr:acetyl-CoA acetyltransferase [Rhodococcus opacus]